LCQHQNFSLCQLLGFGQKAKVMKNIAIDDWQAGLLKKQDAVDNN
jgi:hypothetical protein